MKFKFIQKWLTLTSLTVILAAPVAAQDSGSGDLRKQVLALQQELSRLKAQGLAADRLQELERRIDLLAAEIEKMRTGGAVEAGTRHPCIASPGGARGRGQGWWSSPSAS